MDEVQLSDIIFNIRYRLNNDPNWKYSRSRETRAMLALEDFKHGDEIHLQVQAERAGVIIEDWGQELVASVGTKVARRGAAMENDKLKLHLAGAVEKDGKNGVPVDPQDLLPPLDFTAHVVGPSSVKLEWKPNEGVPKGKIQFKKHDEINYEIVLVSCLSSWIERRVTKVHIWNPVLLALLTQRSK